MMSFTTANLIGGTIFSGVGLAAFIYGKKQVSFKPMIIGAVLMGYPFFITNTVAIYAVGAVLTVALFVFND